MNFLDPVMSQKCLMLPIEPSSRGKNKVKSPPSVPLVTNVVIKNQNSSISSHPHNLTQPSLAEKNSAMPEYQPMIKKKILTVKKNSSPSNIQITKLSPTLDLVLISNEKDSQKLSLGSKPIKLMNSSSPTKIDSVVSVMNSSISSLPIPTENLSYLNIVQPLLSQNLSVMSSPLSPVSPPDCTVSEVMESKTQLKPVLKNTPFQPFWTPECQQISQNWKLIPDINQVNTTILTSNPKEHGALLGSSWFSIQCSNENMSTQKISITEKENIVSLSKPDVTYKTMIFKLHPTQEEKTKLHEMFNIQRYYYNLTVEMYKKNTSRFENTILPFRDREPSTLKPLQKKQRKKEDKQLTEEELQSKDRKNISTIRDLMLCLKPVKGEEKQFFLDKTQLESHYKPDFIPAGMGRVIRGAFEHFEEAYKSTISNGHEPDFKDSKENKYLGFEDGAYPIFLKKINGSYGYRKHNGKSNKKRTSFQLSDARKIQVQPNGKKKCKHNKKDKTNKKTQSNKKPKNKYLCDTGCTFVYDKQTDTYFLHQPVPIHFFPPDDHRESQTIGQHSSEVISMDPGVRKFLTGINPLTGEVTTIGGDHATDKITDLFKQINCLKKIQEQTIDVKNQRYKLWSKIKNMIKDLHWKTASYLSKRYKNVILGDIKVSKIVTGKQTNPSNNKLMLQLSFHKFKQRLGWKCKRAGGNLYLVHEANTTKTCHRCGNIKRQGSSEIYECLKCNQTFDRDINSAYNIALRAFMK